MNYGAVRGESSSPAAVSSQGGAKGMHTPLSPPPQPSLCGSQAEDKDTDLGSLWGSEQG